jgi:hypothetical protein
MSRKAARLLLVFALASSLLTYSLFAQKPVKQPFPYVPREFDAGLVCSFPVLIEGSGNQSILSFPSGREMIVGAGSVRVTNTATGQSVVLATTGRLSTTLLPGDAALLTGSGHSLFLLLPQDVTGPALILTTGRIELLLDIAADTVTAVHANGRTLDVCAALE